MLDCGCSGSTKGPRVEEPEPAVVRAGELEWVEAGRVLTLRSATLSLEELLAVAASLESA